MILYRPDDESFEATLLRIDISKSASSTYSLESMLYMTAGLMDLYQNTNVDVETAIVKVSIIESNDNIWLTIFQILQIFSQDQLLSLALNLSNFVDTPATLEEHPANRLIRDAVQMQTFGEPKDILKLCIGLAGIHHSGVR